MKLFQLHHLLILLPLITTTTSALQYSKEGCEYACGNVQIPYPFGIGANCSINKWYVVDCISSTPYLRAVDRLEVVRVSLINQTVIVRAATTVYDCENQVLNRSQISSIALGRSPFFFSRFHNKFVVEGCANAFISDNWGSVLAGCSTSCRNDTVSENNNCFSINCCETRLPHHLKSYNMNLTRLGRQNGEGACGSAFLVDQMSYDEGNFSGQSIAADNGFLPISLLWTLTDSDVIDDSSCCRGAFLNRTLDVGNGIVGHFSVITVLV